MIEDFTRGMSLMHGSLDLPKSNRKLVGFEDMIRIVVNSPKGGVGKTTLAINIALLLARSGKKVWALDLAQGGQMSKFLRQSGDFSDTSGCKIDVDDLGELPLKFPGASNFDFLVADTDDYHKILENLLDEKRRGWRILTPIVASDFMGLSRIPDELSLVMTAAMLEGNRIPAQIVLNKTQPNNLTEDREIVRNALLEKGISSLLSDSYIPLCSSMPPFFINDSHFESELRSALASLGVKV